MSSRAPIDLDKLERELVGALEADRKYSRENDAKFRAVNQKVATYEEFREIVNASHLNPLERKDLTDTTRKQPWNMVAHLGGRDCSSQLEPQERQDRQEAVSFHRPENGQEFLRSWKKLDAMDRYQYLLSIGGEGLHELFKVEISMGLLGEMLKVLKDGFATGDTAAVLCILAQLSKSSRFSLSVTFLSADEKKAATDLFHQLSLTEQTVYDVSELAKVYSVESNS